VKPLPLENIRWVLIALMAIASSAHAKDCSTSKTFEITHSQVLSGVLEDPTGATLSGIELQLLSRNEVIRRLRTSNQGEYDFGEVAPGKYRIRLEYGGNPLCAPEIKCRAGHCSIAHKVRINSKSLVKVD
jgi:hypothetical protein